MPRHVGKEKFRKTGVQSLRRADSPPRWIRFSRTEESQSSSRPAEIGPTHSLKARLGPAPRPPSPPPQSPAHRSRAGAPHPRLRGVSTTSREPIEVDLRDQVQRLRSKSVPQKD